MDFNGLSSQEVLSFNNQNFRQDVGMHQSQLEQYDHEYNAKDLIPDYNGSPCSSSDSSPKARPQGNRLRAFSLNTKGSNGRSTAHITQQQMNKKRQRATPEQLMVLEEAFLMNPSPNAKMRENISCQINMTERSVQIWFQNRRAKTKLLHKRGGFDDAEFQNVPAEMRPGMLTRSYSIDQGPLADPGLPDIETQHNFNVAGSISRLNCRSLTIGTWRRVACTSMDLVCYFSQNDPCFTYYINSGASGFKIQYLISAITKIDLKYVQLNGSREMGRATITLAQPPIFFMELPSSDEWRQCTDFTENQQATMELDHTFVGPYEHLKKSFTELASAYKETIGLMSFEDLSITKQFDYGIAHQSSSASITQSRTSIVPPDIREPPKSGVMGLSGPKAARGAHRRTRSRSAPIAVDFTHYVSQNNFGGMPGYHFGQQSLRIDPQYRFGGDVQSIATTTPVYEYNESQYTPTSVATPSYQDSWYAPSYTNTPLLDAERSQLGSPLLPGTGPMDLSIGTLPSEGFGGSYPVMTQVQTSSVPAMHLTNPSQSMPDLARLDTVPEIPTMQLQQLQQQYVGNDQLSLNTLGRALDLSHLDFSHVQLAQTHDEMEDTGT